MDFHPEQILYQPDRNRLAWDQRGAVIDCSGMLGEKLEQMVGEHCLLGGGNFLSLVAICFRRFGVRSDSWFNRDGVVGFPN